MKARIALILIALLTITGCAKEEKQMGEIKLTSPAFSDNGSIPDKYTCKGDNINPELNIKNIPEGTQTLVLIMDDPDAPAGTWDHWVEYNLPVSSTIEEDSTPGEQGKNSWGTTGYRGPCPPSGTHRYVFKLYALDTELQLDNPDKKELEKAMQGHILAQAKLTGLSSH